jgi:hypothetical protein
LSQRRRRGIFVELQTKNLQPRRGGIFHPLPEDFYLAQWLNPPGKHANVSIHDEANTLFAGKNIGRIAG